MDRSRRRALMLVGATLTLGACDQLTGPKKGSLTIGIEGLPTGADAQVLLSGPNDFQLTLRGTLSLVDLKPGRYVITAVPVRVSNTRFAVTEAERTFDLGAGRRDSVGVRYDPTTGSVVVNIGAPLGVTPQVRVTGPSAFNRVLTASQLLTDLEPGAYLFEPQPITQNGFKYAGLNATTTVNVQAGTRASFATITVVPTSGQLTIDVAGLPASSGVVAHVTGPAGFTRDVASSVVLSDLQGGTYVIETVSPVIDGVTYQAATAPVQIFVNPGYMASSRLSFLPIGNDGSVLLNFRVQGMTLTQVVQRPDNSVPMIRGRGALLRVFAVGSLEGQVPPVVRVRFYQNGALVDSVSTVAPQGTLRTFLESSDTTGTFNIPVPSALIQPGLGIQVEVDPDRTLTEATRNDNVFPAGAPAAIEVREGRTLGIRIVPILQSVTSLTGEVSEGTKSVFLDMLHRLYPISGSDAEVRATYTTATPALDSRDTSGAWGRILGEMEALRVAEGSSRYYYGVVRTNYRSGVAGVGFIGGRAAIGWDALPSGNGVLAHELGHNFGRRHSPCGGAAGPDPAFPYANGAIGVIGWDSASARFFGASSPDLMSYCHPEWISDYTYMGVMNALGSGPPAPDVIGATEEECLIVWGRIENGVPVLEPAFSVRTRSAMPARGGAHRLRALGAAGDELLAMSFDAREIADRGESRAFAYAVPVRLLGGRAVNELRLTTPTGEARSIAAGGATTLDPELRVNRGASRRASLRWNAARYPLVVVRDVRSGEILSIARNGDAAIRADRSDVELIFSDRVRSTRQRVTLAP